MEKVNQSYWAEQVEIQILAAQAWLAHAQGNRADALKYMRAAADLEDSTEKHVAMENRLYPMRELLADLLLEPGHPMAALKEYELSMGMQRLTACVAGTARPRRPKQSAISRRLRATTASSRS